jgi:hypothetical protein
MLPTHEMDPLTMTVVDVVDFAAEGRWQTATPALSGVYTGQK